MKYFLLFFLLIQNIAVASEEICLDPKLASQPMQADGRITPYFAHAGRINKYIFGKTSCSQLSASAQYCFLSFGMRLDIAKKYNCDLKIRVDHVGSKKLLGLDAKEGSISPELVWAKKDELIQQYRELTKDGNTGASLPTDIATILERAEKLSKIEDGSDWKISKNAGSWVSLKEIKNEANFSNTVFGSGSLISAAEAKSVKFESLYEKLKPFSFAMLLAMLGFLFSILSVKKEKFSSFAMVVLVLLVLLEILGIALRVLVSGRAPVTNMYETVMWSGFCLFILAAIIGFKLKNRKIWAVGFAGNTLCLLMMNFAPGMLDPTIQPLVPVLRDNFWLSTHVTSVTLSYACFALSWLVANYVMIRFIVSPKIAAIEEWNYIMRIAMQVGSVFLSTGVILGGVWADYSWGRFWGWDPKETWSLIALIIYMAILHGKYAGWFKGIMFTVMGGVGFLFVLMAWFGVNYILAVGLHSYGFSSGGALFLAVIFVTQLSIIAGTFMRMKLQDSTNA